MDRYKFRGKHVSLVDQFDSGQWVHGYLSAHNYINSEELGGEMLVDPATVGQVITYYGKEFAKGDLIAIPCYCDSEYGCSHGDGIYEFCWNQEIAGYALRLKGKGRFESLDNYDVDDMTVIGNRWDNPELLE
jgi:hypothetical protein